MKQPNIGQQEISSLQDDIHLESVSYKQYQSDVLFDIHEHVIEFKNCVFESVSMQDVDLENSYFVDCIFKDCDLSNIKILSTLLRRVQFINCKLLGTDFSESVFDDVLLKQCECGFANFSFMKNKEVHMNECRLYNASIIETHLKKTTFQNCSFEQCEVLHSSLYNIDLSTCELSGISTTPQDIQGALITRLQAEDLIHLLGVKIKA